MTTPEQPRGPWGLKCNCEARDRFATLHASRCDLYQKWPPRATTTPAPAAG